MPTVASNESDTGKIIKAVLGIAIFVFLIIAAFSIFYTVESGQEGVLFTFGKAQPDAIQPGLHAKWPFIQSVVRFDVKTQAYGADATKSTLESAASSDLQQVKMRVVVNYHLTPGKTPELYSKVGAAYEGTVIVPTVHEATKSITARFTAADLINKREDVTAEMNALLREKLAPYNIIVEQVSVTDFDFSDQFNQAIEAKVTAEQQKQKADNDLMRIEVEAKQVATKAQGERDAQIALAEAQAKTTELNAKAEALKIQLIQDQLKQSPQYIDLQRVQKWDGKYPNFYMTGGQSPTLLMQVPSPSATQ